MNSNGDIKKISAPLEGYIEIPTNEVDIVKNMNRKQRRAWYRKNNKGQ